MTREALRRVAVRREPRVPGVDVRECDREHARRVRADHQLRPSSEGREENRVADCVELPLEAHAFAGKQPADDREGLFEARDVMVEGQPERTELFSVPPGPERGDEPAAAQLVDGGSLPREYAGRVKGSARDERSELDAFGDLGKPRERRPAIPRPALGAAVTAIQQMV